MRSGRSRNWAGKVRLHSVTRGALALGLTWLAGRCVTSCFVPSPGSRVPQAPQASELLPAVGALVGGLTLASVVIADEDGVPSQLELPDLTPETFKPVCPASDGVYNFGKGLGDTLLGPEGAEYRPLVIEALLRVRLEICVLESFIYEAIIPFIQRKGLSWVLPLHETIDTVIAGTVFTIACNFVLFGTTKVLAILSIYHDFLIGAFFRLIGFTLLPEKPKVEQPFIQINWPGTETPVIPQPTPEEEEEEKNKEPPPTPVLIIGTFFKTYGVASGFVKDVLEGLDTFAGRYLAILSIFYVGFKWAHFRLFNDFPPF